MQLLSAARLRERQVTEFVRDHEVEPGQVIRTTAMFAASGLRTFIVASGVWFMRVGYMALGLGPWALGLGPWALGLGPWALGLGPGDWGLATGGAGIGPAMSDPFDLFWAFATYLLPLAILELCFRAESSPTWAQSAMAGALWLCSAIILAGSGGAWLMMWSPYI